MCLNYLDECTEAKKVAAEKQVWYKVVLKDNISSNFVPTYVSYYQRDTIKLNEPKINLEKERLQSNYDRSYENGFHFYSKAAALNFCRDAVYTHDAVVLICKVKHITDFGVDDYGKNCVAQQYIAIKSISLDQFENLNKDSLCKELDQLLNSRKIREKGLPCSVLDRD